jgi:hypothetical protein
MNDIELRDHLWRIYKALDECAGALIEAETRSMHPEIREIP